MVKTDKLIYLDDKCLGLMRWWLNLIFVQIEATTSGTKTTDTKAAIVPQPGGSHPIQQQVSLCANLTD